MPKETLKFTLELNGFCPIAHMVGSDIMRPANPDEVAKAIQETIQAQIDEDGFWKTTVTVKPVQ